MTKGEYYTFIVRLEMFVYINLHKFFTGELICKIFMHTKTVFFLWALLRKHWFVSKCEMFNLKKTFLVYNGGNQRDITAAMLWVLSSLLLGIPHWCETEKMRGVLWLACDREHKIYNARHTDHLITRWQIPGLISQQNVDSLFHCIVPEIIGPSLLLEFQNK